MIFKAIMALSLIFLSTLFLNNYSTDFNCQLYFSVFTGQIPVKLHAKFHYEMKMYYYNVLWLNDFQSEVKMCILQFVYASMIFQLLTALLYFFCLLHFAITAEQISNKPQRKLPYKINTCMCIL